MRAIDFPEANKQYGKPLSMTDEECYSVSVLEQKDQQGRITMTTVWMPNKEDIKAINAGRPVILTFTHNVLPPHVLYTIDEEGNING